MITRIDLIAAIGRIHANTDAVVVAVTDEAVPWRPAAGEFSIGQIVLHIANARLLQLQFIRGEAPKYRGHRLVPDETAAHLRQALLRSGKKAIAQLHDANLDALVRNVRGIELPAWRLAINGLIEHEVHHRSQLCDSLAAFGIEPPALFGMRVEELPR